MNLINIYIIKKYQRLSVFSYGSKIDTRCLKTLTQYVIELYAFLPLQLIFHQQTNTVNIQQYQSLLIIDINNQINQARVNQALTHTII